MSDDVERLKKRLARERAARLQAEQLLEEKSRMLFDALETLKVTLGDLEERVAERTVALTRFSHIVDQSPATIVITDLSGNVEYVNSSFCERTGFRKEDVIGRHSRQFRAKNTTDETYKELWSTLAAGKTWRGEFLTEKANGEVFWESAALSPIRAEDGSIINYVAIKEDISERKAFEQDLREAKEAAEQAAKAKAVFLATMSHEIRTPMNGVLSLTNLLCQSDLPDDEASIVSVIQQSATALLTIIDDILDFSKIEAGRLAIESIEMSLAETVEGVGDLLALRAEEKGLEFSIDLGMDVPDRLYGDPTRLRQILYSLTSNAIKFTDSGRVRIAVRDVSPDPVEVAGESRPHRVRFEVTDTGIGIPADQKSRLFSPFQQGDGSIARRFGGTGLGLSISRALCGLMHGEIGVESELGHGSTFWFEIPLTPAIPARLPRPEADLSDVTAILIGLSNRTIEAIRSYLPAGTIGGLACYTSAKDALEGFAHGDPVWAEVDTVLCEAGAVGTELERLRDMLAAREQRPALVLVSQRSQASPIREASRLGFLAVLSYPIRRARLWQVLLAGTGRGSLDPRARLQGGNRTAYQPPTVEEARSAGAVVLVAEDNRTNQLVMQKLLDRLGFAHEVAENGEEALTMLEASDYGMLLTDIHMPQMDGFELTRRVRDRETASGLPRMPIIAVTADAFAGADRPCLASGMDGCISKPVDIEVLKQTLERWLPKALLLRKEVSDEERPAEEDTNPAFTEIDREIFSPDYLVESCGGFNETARMILSIFLNRTQELIGDLKAVTVTGDFEKIVPIAHTLKGSACNVGAVRLGQCAADLETVARQADADMVDIMAEGVFISAEEFKTSVAGLVG